MRKTEVQSQLKISQQLLLKDTKPGVTDVVVVISAFHNSTSYCIQPQIQETQVVHDELETSIVKEREVVGEVEELQVSLSLLLLLSVLPFPLSLALSSHFDFTATSGSRREGGEEQGAQEADGAAQDLGHSGN